MKIELKNIKYSAAASEETNFYSAALYVNGKKIGVVSNRGCGGPDDFHGTDDAAYAAYRSADKWCKTNLPVDTYNGVEFPTTLENHCNDLLRNHLIAGELRRLMQRRVVYIEDEKVWEARPVKGSSVEQAARFIRHKHPGATILNDLPFEEALKLYRETGTT